VRYDPMLSPDPVAWLALDEGERIAAVLRYHERAGAEAGSLRAHSAIHAAVETQLAEGRGTTLDALRRLLQEGLDRHEAIHAIGSLVAGELYAAMSGKRSEEGSYDQRLAALSAARCSMTTPSCSPRT